MVTLKINGAEITGDANDIAYVAVALGRVSIGGTKAPKKSVEAKNEPIKGTYKAMPKCRICNVRLDSRRRKVCKNDKCIKEVKAMQMRAYYRRHKDRLNAKKKTSVDVDKNTPVFSILR